MNELNRVTEAETYQHNGYCGTILWVLSQKERAPREPGGETLGPARYEVAVRVQIFCGISMGRS